MVMVMVMVIGYLTLIQEICSVVEACLGVDDCPDEKDNDSDCDGEDGRYYQN